LGVLFDRNVLLAFCIMPYPGLPKTEEDEMTTEINRKLMDDLTAIAKASDRGRKNHNFHERYDEVCQRLLNAVEPGSYIRPHRHLSPPKPETFVCLRGRMALVLFEEGGAVERIVPFGPGLETVGVDIPAGLWHTVVSLESGSIFFETKPGPYCPAPEEDWAPWSPPEGSGEAKAYLTRLEARIREQG
jgi:cupin fold WbuC family metalloprotein